MIASNSPPKTLFSLPQPSEFAADRSPALRDSRTAPYHTYLNAVKGIFVPIPMKKDQDMVN